MSSLPPDHDDDAALDALYRRISAADPSAPGEPARQAVLAHATQLSRRPSVEVGALPVHSWHRPKRTAWRRPVAFGAIAAALLAVFMWMPHTPPRRLQAQAVPRGAADESPVFANITPAEAMRDYAPAGMAAPPPGARSEREPVRRQAQGPAAPVITAASGQPAAAPGAQRSDAATRSAALDGAADLGTRATASLSAAAPPVATARVADAKVGEDPGGMLWRAAAGGDLAALRSLHEQHVNLDLQDAQGRTALMIATLQGHAQAVSALLGYGANPEIRDASGASPLDAALAANQGPIVAELKGHGAH